jgi:GNAT superfamily N-acetyltransferase
VPSSKLTVSAPSTPADFEKYYALRYEVLRKPWSQPLGSERDKEEDTSIHAFIKENEQVLAVGRLQFTDGHTGQVRFMAVDPGQQGKGLGKLIMHYLEGKALEAGRTKVVLHARENALKFYESCGYVIREKSHLLWGQVQHWLMEKEIK